MRSRVSHSNFPLLSSSLLILAWYQIHHPSSMLVLGFRWEIRPYLREFIAGHVPSCPNLPRGGSTNFSGLYCPRILSSHAGSRQIRRPLVKYTSSFGRICHPLPYLYSVHRKSATLSWWKGFLLLSVGIIATNSIIIAHCFLPYVINFLLSSSTLPIQSRSSTAPTVLLFITWSNNG